MLLGFLINLLGQACAYGVECTSRLLVNGPVPGPQWSCRSGMRIQFSCHHRLLINLIVCILLGAAGGRLTYLPKPHMHFEICTDSIVRLTMIPTTGWPCIVLFMADCWSPILQLILRLQRLCSQCHCITPRSCLLPTSKQRTGAQRPTDGKAAEAICR